MGKSAGGDGEIRFPAAQTIHIPVEFGGAFGFDASERNGVHLRKQLLLCLDFCL
jgi:hypothetical protein